MSIASKKLEAQSEDLVERNTKTMDAKRTKWTSKDYAIKSVFPFPRQPTKRLPSGRVGATSDLKK